MSDGRGRILAPIYKITAITPIIIVHLSPKISIEIPVRKIELNCKRLQDFSLISNIISCTDH